MPIVSYRAKQSTDTSGTGTLVLNAAGSNARSFQAAFGNTSRRVHYCISWANGFEIGLGDFDGGNPGSLTRATILASSNAGGLVTLPAGTKDVFSVIDPAAREVISISATATLTLADVGNAVVFSGTAAATLNLPAVATVPLGAGWWVRNGGTATLTIDPNAAETVNGGATLVLQPGQAALIYRVGSGWDAILAAGSAIGLALSAVASAAAAADVISAAPVDVASAATTDIGAVTSPNVRITGTTTITSFGTAAAGVRRQLRFAAALTLTNSANLILPSAANITTAADDTAEVESRGAGVWQVRAYQRAAGLPVLPGAAIGSGLTLATARVLGRVSAGSGAIEEIPLGNAAAALALGISRGTEQNTTSGTAIDFTGIPAGVRRITVMMRQVSHNSASLLALRLGTSGGIVATGYDGIYGYWSGAGSGYASQTTGLLLHNAAAAEETSGIATFVNQSANLWLCSFHGFLFNGANWFFSQSSAFIDLGGVLDRFRLTTVAGTPVFDKGAINIMWEF